MALMHMMTIAMLRRLLETPVQGALLCSALTLGLTSCGGREAAPPAAQTTPPNTEAARAAPQPSGPQWPRAAAIDPSARAALPAPAAGRLQESPVPVLVPNDARILQRSEAVVLADQYTLTSKVDDATVSIQASPAQPAGRGERSVATPRTQVGSRAVFFTENEAIRVATWIENGVAYSAEVECAKADDPKCRDYTYLRSIVERLVFVGGRGARLP
jgi:hypothetical protein